MKRFLMTTAAILTFGLGAMPAQAEMAAADVKATIEANAPQTVAERYVFDKAHTQILFFVNHLGFSMSQGEFLDFDGHFMYDEANPENSSIDVVIKTASIDMDDEKWDDHMKNEDFFDVEKFPEMTFKSTDIEVTGENTANITGDLTILGVTKPVTLAVTHNKTGIHPYSKKKHAGFSATATIDRTQWGMNYGVPNVGEEVEIRLEVEGSQQDMVESTTEIEKSE